MKGLLGLLFKYAVAYTRHSSYSPATHRMPPYCQSALHRILHVFETPSMQLISSLCRPRWYSVLHGASSVVACHFALSWSQACSTSTHHQYPSRGAMRMLLYPSTTWSVRAEVGCSRLIPEPRSATAVQLLSSCLGPVSLCLSQSMDHGLQY